MPELPEVETYIRELEPLLSGRRVIAAQIHWTRIVATPSVAEFRTRIAGRALL